MKPEPVPYVKGGLKGVLDVGYNVGSGIANRAGAMYESIKIGLTANLFMRGLGLSRQQLYQDTHPTSSEDNSDNDDDEDTTQNDHYNDIINNNTQENLATTSTATDNNINNDKSKNIDISKKIDNKLHTSLSSSPHYSKSIPGLTTTTPTNTTSINIHAKHLKEYQLDTNGSSSNRIRSNSDPAFAFSSSPSVSTVQDQQSPRQPSNLSRQTPSPLPLLSSHSHGARKLKLLNVNGRVDYALQEGLLENPYLNALNAHMQYWQDFDVGAFIVREIYR